MEDPRPPSDKLKEIAEAMGVEITYVATSSGWPGYQAHLYKVGSENVLECEMGGNGEIVWEKDDWLSFAQSVDHLGLIQYLK